MIKAKKIFFFLMILLLTYSDCLLCENQYYDPTKPEDNDHLDAGQNEEKNDLEIINKAKLNFIFYSDHVSRCIINDQELHENDDFYGFKVKHIFNNHVLLEKDRNEKNIYLAKGFSENHKQD